MDTAALFKNASIKELCELFVETNHIDDDASIPIVRGWLMEEMEKRNPERFDAWMMAQDKDDIDHPERFLVNQE